MSEFAACYVIASVVIGWIATGMAWSVVRSAPSWWIGASVAVFMFVLFATLWPVLLFLWASGTVDGNLK